MTDTENLETQKPEEETENKPKDSIEPNEFPFSEDAIKDAENRLKDMAPQNLLWLEDSLDQARQDADDHICEYRGVAWCKLYRGGVEFNITERGHTSKQALDNLVHTVIYAKKKYDLNPPVTVGTYPAKPQNGKQTEPTKSDTKKTAPTHQPRPDGKKSTESNGESLTSGIHKLNKVIVVDEGDKTVVHFHVGAFRWPFSEHRGIQFALEKFDPTLGWTEEHFSQPATYIDGRDFSNLVVQWEKSDKYYNVIRVFDKSSYGDK